jgi:SAM-dependent methyltransferase
MLQKLNDIYYRLPDGMINLISTFWYIQLAALDRDTDMLFMNYGWAALDDMSPAPQMEKILMAVRESENQLALLPKDEKDRYCIQLYHRTLAAVDVRGMDVLEVGSGRGGGASYIQRYLAPRSMTGLDRTAPGIRFCQRHYAVPGLAFVQGMAQSLAFPAASFDAVVNIESSHCYNGVQNFWKSVHRVLKPGGCFLLADYRKAGDIPALRSQLTSAGFSIEEEENISANVLRALELDNDRKTALIESKIPRGYRLFFKEFAGTVGTGAIYATLRNEEIVYLRFLLRRC